MYIACSILLRVLRAVFGLCSPFRSGVLGCARACFALCLVSVCAFVCPSGLVCSGCARPGHTRDPPELSKGENTFFSEMDLEIRLDIIF